MSPTSATPAAGKKLMTADEFWEFVHRPENEPRYFVLIRGEVQEVPRPTKTHGIVQIRIGRYLEEWAEKVGRGYVAAESGVVLTENPDTVAGPDVAYYTDADTFDEVPPKWGEVAPVLAVEILSPNDKMSRVNTRIREYLLSGTRVVWLVDYEERKVTVYRPDKLHDVIGEDGELTGGDDLPGLTVRLADLFRLPGQKPSPPQQPPAT